MRVTGDEVVAMIDLDHIAVTGLLPDEDDPAGRGRQNRLAIGADEVEACARRLVRAIFPVGVRCVGPDVAHPLTIGDLKIVPPDVTHPNFIYWNGDSVSFPKDR